MIGEQERIALEYGPVVVLEAARELEGTRGRAKDKAGRVTGVRELEQLAAALRLAPDLDAEHRRALFAAVATDATLALLVRLITDAEQAAGPYPSHLDTPATGRAVLGVLIEATRQR